MDLENHRKHSFSNRMRSGIPESHTQCPGPFSVLQGQMQPRNTSRSEDAKNIASDLFRTGACISGRQQKWLQCIIQMFSWFNIGWIVTVEFPLQTVNIWILRKPSATFFEKVIRIWTEFTCLRVLEIIFENPETRKVQRKVWGLVRSPIRTHVFFCYAILYESEHTKLMNSLIINL